MVFSGAPGGTLAMTDLFEVIYSSDTNQSSRFFPVGDSQGRALELGVWCRFDRRREVIASPIGARKDLRGLGLLGCVDFCVDVEEIASLVEARKDGFFWGDWYRQITGLDSLKNTTFQRRYWA
jgi:hypothetical protein